MSKVKIKLNYSAIQSQLLKGDGTKNYLESIASRALQRLGDGYSMNTYYGKTRLNVEVLAESHDAIHEQLYKNTIMKAVWSK